MSHSPLLNLPGPSAELLDDIRTQLVQTRAFVQEFDPELVVVFSPDHYNGFFYRLMPPFCIGTAATGVGDYGTLSGPLGVDAQLATDIATAAWDDGVDVSLSAAMDVDHGTVQPLEILFGDGQSGLNAPPIVPVFINSVATPLGPLKRTRALGSAIGKHLGTLGKRVLLLGSGGLSHDPPVPTLATAPPAALERIVGGKPMTPEARAARQEAVIAAAHDFAHGESPLQPLNPDWDHAFLDLLDDGRIAEVDGWTNEWIAGAAGNSAHEIRTWVAAFAALSAQGSYRTEQRYYRAAPDLIAGFAIRTAVLT
ncbi:3-carboxyethylcatechol 2,3-dioxygenase [Mycobacterium sp. AMU20-3851]|uniref:3-carboxyethylcatechol 2,3-dioxygenase n=1 Tax=Mycobacterium sp. AMU20-3851 TaxID=3122055 RepID=UPI0037548C0C